MGKGRERQIISTTVCPTCHAARGRPCGVKQGRPMVHSERKAAWQQARPKDALDADITLSYQHEGPVGQRQTVMVFAPLTDRGRRVMPAMERLDHDAGTARLRELQARGIVVMREDQ